MRLGSLILYGAGQLGIMLLMRFFVQWVVFFGESGKDADVGPLFVAGSIGAVVFGFRIFDGITDPMAGTLADRWVGSGKQRRSLIWVSFLIPAVGLFMIFSPSHAMNPALRWILMGGGMFIFFVGYTLYAVPYWSLVDDYSQGDPRTRTSLSNILGIGILLATGIGFVGSPPLVDILGYLPSVALFCIIGTILMALPYFAAPKDVKNAKLQKMPGIWEALRATLTHKRFAAVIVLFAGAQMSLTVMSTSAAFIATDLLLGTKKDVALLLGPFLVAAVPTFVFVPRMARKYGWEKATLFGTIALSMAYMGAGLLGKGIIGSPMTTAMIVFACAGPGCAFVLGLEGEAITRCADVGTHKSVGVYFGVYNFVVKALNGLAVFLTGLLAAMNATWAVRAMPIMAGFLCLLGVGIYWLMRDKPEPALEMG